VTLDIITETPPAQQQLDLYNKASSMVKRSTYNVNAGLSWAVVGLVLNDAVTTDDEDDLINSIMGLSEVTTVANPRFWGQTPPAILINPGGSEPDTHQTILCVESFVTGNIGYSADVRSFQDIQFESIEPPLNKKWIVCNMVVPAHLASAQMITDLETALVGVTGVTLAEHLVGGVIPDNASNTQIKITTRMRIEPIPA
jgi:hypothetical protein